MAWGSVAALAISAAASYMANKNRGDSETTTTKIQSKPFKVRLPSGAEIMVTKDMGTQQTTDSGNSDAAIWDAVASAANTYTKSEMGKDSSNKYTLTMPSSSSKTAEFSFSPKQLTYKGEYGQ